MRIMPKKRIQLIPTTISNNIYSTTNSWRNFSKHKVYARIEFKDLTYDYYFRCKETKYSRKECSYNEKFNQN